MGAVTKMESNMAADIFAELGLQGKNAGAFGNGWVQTEGGNVLASINPTTGEVLAEVNCATTKSYEKAVVDAEKAFETWRMVPAPERGEMVRQIGNAFREHKEALGKLISLEVGKITSEGLGEVQEAIDICDFAVGLSRQLYGLTMHSERPGHRMYEQWHPLGVTGIITAFNFPCAVWAWNSTIAAVCGNTMVWKPSEKTPLISIALHMIADKVLTENGYGGVMNLVISDDKKMGEAMAADTRLPLISATGSIPMGRSVGQVVAERFGKSLLELGGNNAIIVMDDADMELSVRGIAFGAVGTAGQRCTTTRRVLVQKSKEKELLERLEKIYGMINIGDPMNDGILMGPLIDQQAVDNMQTALKKIKDQGGEIVCGGEPMEMGGGFFVKPALVHCKKRIPMMDEEVFAPILYVMPFDTIEEAIQIQNDVPQGLSSAIFTQNMKKAEKFLSHAGSDCGIANVNIGTSGAEIGGAFGGEKETGGGRESGSDAWKAYMRRQTCTLNWSDELPLAQGVEFI
jgi:aldehyde dehydrogenase (NAD+)